MPLKPDELCAEFRAVYHEAKDRGLRVRPDGFVPVGEVINKSDLLHPKIIEEAGQRMYEPTITIGQFVNAVEKDETLSLLHEPRLHWLGEPDPQLVWWIRDKVQPAVPKYVDQATYRIMPGSKVRNAIYKAGVTEWDHIRIHGIRPTLDEEMIVMASVDKIEERIKNSSFVYIFIDMERAMKGGVEFFFTRHLQVVSPGNRSGVIPPRFFKDAVRVLTKTKTFRPAANRDARDAYA